MSISFGYFACLLLYLPSAQAALTITIPEDTVQAKPGSDVLLPCYVEESSGHLNLERLTVIWRVDSETIAKYEDTLEANRQGAKMTREELQKGNASLLLPNVQDTDSKTYTCFVIHRPDSEKREVNLKVEAPPLIELGSTKVQLTKPSQLVCTAKDFYPGNISVTWFRNEKIVQGPEWPPAWTNGGLLFRAKSVLELIPQITDADANFTCHIQHQAMEGPLALNFQLQLQARPDLRLLTKPSGKEFVAAVCHASKFYPSQISIEWLQNGVPQTQVKTEAQRMHNGMFSVTSVLFPEKSDVEVTYTCRVEHGALNGSQQQSVLWQPEVTSTTSSAIPWLLGLAIGFGSGFSVGAAIMCYKYKVKRTSVTGMSSEKIPLRKPDEEKVHAISKPKAGETGDEPVNQEKFHYVQEQQL
ncbi:tyrosine-protein phosphatase non-receptor type substrate 1-like isoform X2 [Python bivittatus]|uniref:Tyrosine-protein phosphatase non-receptor type substrate 1-like isoform X2 n=1 Tax=Python bivittatus TaxID=176946 RepID=A0A9F2NGN9_PYTBI|nr:tyrosine-protein phosphatase non-receptor type substrate 1-like isoform X2 [Python bivittatus]